MLWLRLFSHIMRRREGDPGRKATVTTLAVVTLGLALLALLTPLSRAEFPASRVGGLLAIAASVELVHALRRSTAAARRQATIGAVISMAIAIFLINAPYVAGEALRLLVAGWFGVDALRYAIGAFRRPDREQRSLAALAFVGNGAVAFVVLFARDWAATWVVAIAGASRIIGIAWNIMVAPVFATTEADETVVGELGLADEPEAAAMATEIEARERVRAPIDRTWTLAFVATLFAIHIGRMRVERTFLGLISPAVAVLGDMAVAVLVTLLVINPLYLMWRGPTRWIERRLWRLQVRRPDGARKSWVARATQAWLRFRMTYAIRMRTARYSVPAALNQGLQMGLPIAAVLAATVPVWGMSWYFDTENWAAGMWNSWAESRTDTWREAMVRAVVAGSGGQPSASTFAVEPDGVSGDFAFIVIGDTGKGMRHSTSCAINCWLSPIIRTCVSSSSLRTSCIRPAP